MGLEVGTRSYGDLVGSSSLLLLADIHQQWLRQPASPPHDSRHDAHRSTSCQPGMKEPGAARLPAARHHSARTAGSRIVSNPALRLYLDSNIDREAAEAMLCDLDEEDVYCRRLAERGGRKPPLAPYNHAVRVGAKERQRGRARGRRQGSRKHADQYHEGRNSDHWPTVDC